MIPVCNTHGFTLVELLVVTAKRSFSRSSVRPGYNMERVGEEWRVSSPVINSGRDQERFFAFERGADSLSICVVERKGEV